MQCLFVEAQGVKAVWGYGVKPPHPALFFLLPPRSVGCAFESSERKVCKTTGLSEVLGHRSRVTVQNAEHMFRDASTELTPGFANIADMATFAFDHINNTSIRTGRTMQNRKRVNASGHTISKETVFTVFTRIAWKKSSTPV